MGIRYENFFNNAYMLSWKAAIINTKTDFSFLVEHFFLQFCLLLWLWWGAGAPRGSIAYERSPCAYALRPQNARLLHVFGGIYPVAVVVLVGLIVIRPVMANGFSSAFLIATATLPRQTRLN